MNSLTLLADFIISASNWRIFAICLTGAALIIMLINLRKETKTLELLQIAVILGLIALLVVLLV